SMLCDSGLKSLKLAETFTGKRLVTIDVPMDMHERSIRYVAQQLKELAASLEEATGRRMSLERLKEVILCSNRTREKIQEINELRAKSACPLKGSSALNFMLSSHILLGSQGAEKFYERLAGETKEHINREGNRGKSVPHKPIRILWLEAKPYFNCDLMLELEERHGVKIVFDELNYIYWEALDPENPYESLARKLISHHMNGRIERRLEVIKHLARKYSVDGIIVFSHWGCRRHLPAVPTLKRELEKEGYPFLSLDGDCVDSRNYTPGQFATRVEGFLEMLRGKIISRAKANSGAVLNEVKMAS
ncbi:MAG TPA: 2-hydroxyacyl-CoA dehydratase subunit D, partial [Candidatus Hypogeohydataceae bacterium YC41]